MPNPPKNGAKAPAPHDSNPEAGASKIIDLDDANQFLTQSKAIRDQLGVGVHSRMAFVSAMCQRIPKRGRNTFHGYDYVMESDVVAEVTKWASLAGLTITFEYAPSGDSAGLEYETTQNRQGNPQLTLKGGGLIIITSTDDSKDSVEHYFPSMGKDEGDKAPFKFMTGMKKYALMQTFGISTGDDPEGSATGDEDPNPRNAAAQDTPDKRAERQRANDERLAGAGNVTPIDANEQKKAKQKIFNEKCAEMARLSTQLVEMGVLPKDDVERGDRMRKLLLNVTAKGSNTDDRKKCSIEELDKFIDVLNGFIADKQAFGNGGCMKCKRTKEEIEAQGHDPECTAAKGEGKGSATGESSAPAIEQGTVETAPQAAETTTNEEATAESLLPNW